VQLDAQLELWRRETLKTELMLVGLIEEVDELIDSGVTQSVSLARETSALIQLCERRRNMLQGICKGLEDAAALL